MAKLIGWNLVTVDGYFEGAKKWDLDFHNLAWGPELERLSEEFGDKAASLVFGRVTYEGMAAHWKTAEPSKVTHLHERPAEARCVAHAENGATGTTAASPPTSCRS